MKRPAKPFALCLDNVGNEVLLILGKVYRILPDARAAKDDSWYGLSTRAGTTTRSTSISLRLFTFLKRLEKGFSPFETASKSLVPTFSDYCLQRPGRIPPTCAWDEPRLEIDSSRQILDVVVVRDDG